MILHDVWKGGMMMINADSEGRTTAKGNVVTTIALSTRPLLLASLLNTSLFIVRVERIDTRALRRSSLVIDSMTRYTAI